MERSRNFTVRSMLELFGKGEIYFEFNDYKAAEMEIEAKEFLRYSKEDLVDDSDRGRVNALSNAKRSIEARVDHIIRLNHLRSIAIKNRWTFPYKLLVLRKIGVPSPDMLRDYITSKRNLLEHEYLRPKKDEVKYLADIVELFLLATEQNIRRGYLQKMKVTTIINEKESGVTTQRNKKLVKRTFVTRDEVTVLFQIEKQTIDVEYKRVDTHGQSPWYFITQASLDLKLCIV